MRQIFITGGTGYMGSRLIGALLERGHHMLALARPGSQSKLPPGCVVVVGNALDGDSYARHIGSCDTFVQLVGVAHPGPAKAREFVEIDQKSAMEAIRVAAEAGIAHFVYVSVAHPAPMMHAYIEARSACEAKLGASGLNATVLRPGTCWAPAIAGLCADPVLLVRRTHSVYPRGRPAPGSGDGRPNGKCAGSRRGKSGGGDQDRGGS